jgi:hypothetical protein
VAALEERAHHVSTDVAGSPGHQHAQAAIPS